MAVAIIGARWADVDLETRILGVAAEDVVTSAGASSDDIVAAAAGAAVILAGPRPRFDEATLEKLGCRGIVRYGVGYDNIDIAAASRLGIKVAYVPDYGTETVALHALSLALAALRRIPQLDASLKAGGWGFDSARPLHMPSELTAGVVGFGRIGRATAKLLGSVGFGRVIVHDEFVSVEEEDVSAASLDELLAESDLVTLHAPGGADGAPLLGAAELSRMKSGSVLVNTARGSLIDSSALRSALLAGAPAVAALDVFDPEPVDLSQYAGVEDRIIMTPHVAWYTVESETVLRTKTAEEAKRILEGAAPLNPVPAGEES